MGSISVPNTFSASTTISSSAVNSNFTTIYNEFNGSIEAANLANDAVTTSKILDANVTTDKLADGSVTAGKVDFGGGGTGVWWEEIARTTLGSAGDTITVSSIPARKYLKVIGLGIATGGVLDTNFTLDNDTGTNYHLTYVADLDGTAVVGTSYANCPIEIGQTDIGQMLTMEIELTNIGSQEKNFVYRGNSQNAAGAAQNSYLEAYGKWENTSTQISRIDWNNVGAGDFAIGSEVIILGHD
jgi:hypothetical protein